MSLRDHSSSSLSARPEPHHGWRDAAEIDRLFGRAAERSARLDRELDLPLHAKFLPPAEHFKLTEQHARDTLRAQGAENTHNLVAWQQAYDLAAARTEQEMLRATGSMHASARAYAHGGVRGSPSPSLYIQDSDNNKAHADFARYQAHAAVADPEHTADNILRALRVHRTTPLHLRGPLWDAVEVQLQPTAPQSQPWQSYYKALLPPTAPPPPPWQSS